MPNTALNRTTAALLTNRSGGAVSFGAVVIQDTANASSFTTTTTEGLSTRQVGVVLEPDGIANNASGMVALGGWVPQINLDGAATIGQFIKTDTVAGQGTPHSSPQVEGDFAVALTASATPIAILLGSPNPAGSGGVISSTYRTRVITAIFDGGSTTPVVNSKVRVEVPIACTITAARIVADQSGSAVVDIWKDTYANFPPTIADTITAAAKPTLSAAIKNQDTTLTGWTTSLNAGDWLIFNLDSVTTCQQVVVTLTVVIP